MTSTVDPARPESSTARATPVGERRQSERAGDRVGDRGSDRVAVPSLTWPLVERRQNRAPGHQGPERRRSELAVPRQVDQSLVPAMEPFRWAAVAVGLIVAMRSFSPHS
jgi:hypothetical protein